MEKQTIYYRLFPGQERIDDGFDDIHRRAFLKYCIFLSEFTHSGLAAVFVIKGTTSNQFCVGFLEDHHKQKNQRYHSFSRVIAFHR